MRCGPMPRWLRERIERLCRPQRGRGVVRFQLDEWYGHPPVRGGGVWIADSREEAEAELRRRYGARLIWMRSL